MKKTLAAVCAGILWILISNFALGAGFFEQGTAPAGGYPSSPTFVHWGAQSGTATDNIVSDKGLFTSILRRGGFDVYTKNDNAALIALANGALDNSSLTLNDIITAGPWVDVRKWGFRTDNTAAANVAAWNANIAAGMKLIIPPGIYPVDNSSALPGLGTDCFLKTPSNIDVGGFGIDVTTIKNTSAGKVRTFCNSDWTNGNGSIRIHDLTIWRTVLTGSYVGAAGNWNDSIAFDAQNGTGANLLNNHIERVKIYSTATPANAGDKGITFRGVKGWSVKDSIVDADVDAFVTAGASSTYPDAHGLVEGNHIYSIGKTYAASAIVGTAGHVQVKNNFMYTNVLTGQSPTFVEVGLEVDHHPLNWEVSGNTLQSDGRANLLMALAARNVHVHHNTIESRNASYPGAMIAFTASTAGENLIDNVTVSSNTIIGGAISFSSSDNTGTLTDIAVEDNKIFGSIQRSGITISTTGAKKNIVVRNNRVRRAGNSGLVFEGPFTFLTVDGNHAWENGIEENGSYQSGFSTYNVTGGPFYFTNNQAIDNSASPKQLWGFHFETGTPNIDVFTNNIAKGNVSGSFRSISGAVFFQRWGNKFGSGPSQGVATLVNGTVTITGTNRVGGITNRVLLQNINPAGTTGTLYMANETTDGFDIKSTSGTDNSDVYWELHQ